MRLAWIAGVVALAGCSAAPVAVVPQAAPDWAYPGNPAPASPAADDGTRLSLAGSDATFTRTQLLDQFGVPDWYPREHPAMPAVVAVGRKPEVRACGFCHLPNGEGRPENAQLAGLPASYIAEQMHAFASGARRSSIAHRAPPEKMEAIAKAANDAEIATAAAYFAGLPGRSELRVIEAAMVPRTIDKSWIKVMVPGGGTEPIAGRIIETPADFDRFERRDPHVPIIAYVPVGAIARGAAIAKGQGAHSGIACAACHGGDLRGQGAVPGLAGRSPSYLARQLHDFRTGARGGAATAPMAAVVAQLQASDVVDVVAYLGSLKQR